MALPTNRPKNTGGNSGAGSGLPVNRMRKAPVNNTSDGLPDFDTDNFSMDFEPIDDSFSSIDIDDDYDDDLSFDDIFEESYSEPEPPKPSRAAVGGTKKDRSKSDNPMQKAIDENKRIDEDVRIGPFPLDEEITDENIAVPSKPERELKKHYTEDTFIDEKNLKLKPIGSGRKKPVKHKTKVSDYDSRKNAKTTAVVIRTVVLGLLAVIMLLGLKNAFIPPETMDESQIIGIVNNQTGVTGFPMETGAAFATNFMKAFLTIDNTDRENTAALSYFYNGKVPDVKTASTGSDSNSRSISGKIEQDIVSGPTVFQEIPFTYNSSSYVIGALVKTTELPDTMNDEQNNAEPFEKMEWKFYQVNVYYNDVDGSMSITSDSPNIIPPKTLKGSGEAPEAAALGTADSNLNSEVLPTVVGYLREYAKFGVDNPQTSSIDQFIDVNSPFVDDLRKGLNNKYYLAEDNSGVSVNTFINSDGEIKVDTTVVWQESVGEKSTLSHRSKYVVTLEKIGDKYLVTKFAPKLYEPSN